MALESRRRQNGHAPVRLGVLATPGGMTLSYDDPMSKVFALDASSSSATRWLVYFLGAVALLLGLAVGARVASVLVAMTNGPPPPAMAPQEIDVMRDEPPPPPPPAPEPEAKPEPAPPPKAVAHEAPPPAPAQAGKVLTQEPDPNEPVDLTNTIISGNADSYAGGFTTPNGTNAKAVHAMAAPTGTPTGTAAPKAAPVETGPDRSRRASVGSAEWNAPFPPEADQAQINEAYVMIEVDVRADGAPAAVRVLKDPGNGFGREARRYAMTQHLQPALDHEGNPIATTIRINVHFSR